MSVERYVSTDATRELVDHDNDSWRLRLETRDHVAEITGDDAVRVDGEPVEPLSWSVSSQLRREEARERPR
ncbi:MAG: hypothetical protein A07HR67_02022 [uncultured archaeon A07HR67]|nr:MAG: hypothetical protein A07HR67_02022 [uncultured archaeon A07HR67]